MSENDTLLIDEPLVPDPDAEEELGATDVEAIADEDLTGSRLLLVRRAIEPLDLGGTPGGVVQLACTFQPASGARFTSAQLRLRLATPAGIRIIDLAPRSLDDPNPVEFTLDKKGQLGLKSFPVEPGVEIGSSKKYVKYHCKVQGSGEGTGLARWDFKENPDRGDGIGQEQVLTLTLPVIGPVTGSVIVSARLARSGLRGKMAAIRDLILNKKPDEHFYPIRFEIPEKPTPGGLARFLRLF
jgi:hypothetical protein